MRRSTRTQQHGSTHQLVRESQKQLPAEHGKTYGGPQEAVPMVATRDTTPMVQPMAEGIDATLTLWAQ